MNILKPIFPLYVNRKSLGFMNSLAIACLFINFTLPKAGFYVDDFPITFGYVLAGVFTVIKLLISTKHFSEPYNRLGVLFFLGLLISLISFVIISNFTVNGNSSSILYFIIAYGLVPILAYNVCFHILSKKELFERIIYFSAILVSIYGVLQFIFLNYFKINILLPFITVTGPDVNVIFDKNITRGSFYKAVGSYNNGNILGVNFLMFMPLALFYGRSLLSNISSRILILVTLSRTVWVVWIFVEVLMAILSKKVSRVIMLFPIVVIGIYVIIGFTSQFATNTGDFLLDSNLGGRAEYLNFNPSVLPSTYTPIAEIVYAAILKSYGIVGLLVFLIVFVSPLFLRTNNKYVVFAKIGMIGYLAAMFLDGAFTLVPTTFIYWSLGAYVFHSYLVYTRQKRKITKVESSMPTV